MLEQFDDAGLNGSVISRPALSEPCDNYMTLDPAPLALAGSF